MVMTSPPSPISAEMQRALMEQAMQQGVAQPVEGVPGFAHPAVTQVISQPYSGPSEMEAAIGSGVKEGALAAIGSWVLLNVGRWGDYVKHGDQELIDLVKKMTDGEIKSISSVYTDPKSMEQLFTQARNAVNGRGDGFFGWLGWNKPDISGVLEQLQKANVDIDTFMPSLTDVKQVQQVLDLKNAIHDVENAVGQNAAKIEGAPWKNYVIGAAVCVVAAGAAMKAVQHVKEARKEHQALQETAEGLRRDFAQQYMEGAAQSMMLGAAQAEVEALTDVAKNQQKVRVIDAVAGSKYGTPALAIPTTADASLTPHDDAILAHLSPEVAKVVAQSTHDEKKSAAPQTKIIDVAEVKPMLALPPAKDVGTTTKANEIIVQHDPTMSITERQDALRAAAPLAGMMVGG